MITQLTKKQEASVVPFRESWRAIGLSTEVINVEATKKAITALYEKLGKKAPLFIFCPSPLWCIQQINLFKFLDKEKISELGNNLRNNLENNLWTNLRTNLRNNLENNLRTNLETNLWNNLRNNLETNLRNNLENNLENNLRTNLETNLWNNLRNNLRTNLENNLENNLRSGAEDDRLMKEFNEYHDLWTYGQMESAWIGFYQFMETIGIKYDDKDSELLELWAQTAKSCSWFWTFENYVFVSDRPTKLSFDAEYRLHDEHGSSYQYSDGWSGYYLHGVHFPKELYLKVISREMPMAEIMAIEDIDQRVQAMKFAKTGLRDFYQAEKGEMVDSYVKMDVKGRPINYELWKIPAGGTFTKTVHFAIYDCPSGRERGEEKEYSKGVPEFKTVAEAMAWGVSDDTHVLTPEDWKSLIPLVHES